MKVIKKTDQYTIFQKRSGRYAVQGEDKNMINGEEKAQILLAEGLIKLAAPAEPEPEVEETAEEVAEEAAEEEASAEPDAAEEEGEKPAE